MNNKIFWGILIFIAAAVFRLTFLDLIEFKLDEARDVYEMEKFYSDPYFIQRGTIQSTGVYNPPLWYYILAIIALPSRDPQYLSFMIALINCLAVAGFYLVVRKFYGQFVGVSAGLLVAFSPWMIVMSRKIWAPDMVFPLVVPWLYFLHVILLDSPRRSPAATIRGVGWAWFGMVGTLMLLAQLHASGIFLAVGTVIVLAIAHLRGRVHLEGVRAHLPGVIAGLVLGLIPLLPYLGYQIQNGCPDCQAFLAYQAGEAITAVPTFDPNAFLRPFQFINGSGFQNALGEEVYRQFLENYPLIGFFNYVFLLQFLLLPIGAFYLYRFRIKSGMTAVGTLLLVSLLVFISKTPAHLYYFLIISPISILIYSLGISVLRSHLIQGATLVIIMVINIIFTFSLYKFLGDFGVSYGVIKQLSEEKLIQFKDRPDYNLIRAEYWVNLFN